MGFKVGRTGQAAKLDGKYHCNDNANADLEISISLENDPQINVQSVKSILISYYIALLVLYQHNNDHFKIAWQIWKFMFCSQIKVTHGLLRRFTNKHKLNQLTRSDPN